MILKMILLFMLTITELFALVDLNNGSAEDFLKLNGIGKAKSQKIIDYREIHKCFKSIDELADVTGISQKIVLINRANLTLGVCSSTTKTKESAISSLKDVLLDPINLLFVVIIFILGVLDYKTGKDLKSQIISVGVLGTFVGIFIGLQGFDPSDIKNSVNDILLGLKTAFFTSIVGMSVSISLSVLEELRAKPEKK
jgi:competence ComEA-like helix-hairpin-helix protein